MIVEHRHAPVVGVGQEYGGGDAHAPVLSVVAFPRPVTGVVAHEHAVFRLVFDDAAAAVLVLPVFYR